MLQTLYEKRLPALYAEFVILDRREIDFKKRKLEGADPNGEEEAQLRHKFLGGNLVLLFRLFAELIYEFSLHWFGFVIFCT